MNLSEAIQIIEEDIEDSNSISSLIVYNVDQEALIEVLAAAKEWQIELKYRLTEEKSKDRIR